MMHTPVLDMLTRYAARQDARFHMPGHKGRALPEGWEAVARLDVTELADTDDLRRPAGAFAEAQRLAAAFFGASQTFFLTGGASSGIAAALLGLLQPGEQIIASRDCHRAVTDACVLGGMDVCWLDNAGDSTERISGCVTGEMVDTSLVMHPGVRAVVITAPDYYGRLCDMRRIAQAAHAHGAYLIVDCAHGAHLGVCALLPASPGQCGADVWVASAHKTLAALTQGAYLHVAEGVDASRIARAIALVETSSPSFLIAASLDWARASLQERGASAIDALLLRCQQVTHAVGEAGFPCPHAAWVREGLAFACDPTRLVFDTAARGVTGAMAFDVLRASGVQVEMYDERRVVCIATLYNTRQDFDRLSDALVRMAKAARDFAPEQSSAPWPTGLPVRAMGLRQAWFAPRRMVKLADAAGCVLAEGVGIYPPGIPLAVAGELLDMPRVQLLQAAASRGMAFGVDHGQVAVVGT
nr:aminotransferase class V-fold PLP-dependent enzyme [Maliibacterium massiliense]